MGSDILMMAYQTITEYMNSTNSSGLDSIFVYAARTVPIFAPLFLFSLFMIILLGTYLGSRKFSGQANFLSSAAIASFITAITAVILSLEDGLVDLYTLTTTLVIASVFVILFLLPTGRNE